MRVSTIYLRALSEGVRLVGGDLERLAACPELARHGGEGGYGWVDLAEHDRACAAAMAIVGRDDFGVLWGSSLFQQFDLGRAAAYAPTLRAALALLDQFQTRLADAPELTFEERGDYVCFSVHPLAIDPACRRMRSDFAVVAMMRLLRQFAVEHCVREITFSHPRPGYAYQPALLAPILFACESTGFVLERSALDHASPGANAELEGVMRRAAATLMPEPERPSGMGARVTALLERSLSFEGLRMGALARELSLSERSLRRALAREGLSFQQLVHRVRVARAHELLRASRLSVKEVAAATGFNSPTAFQRAFKRATGVSPSEVPRS